ncbi:MAG: glycosyltransferase family 4 protein [Endomicrobiia bacterium]|nr:glycosyltransferase family 4 protein [Endomicrobiia bacterium]
MPKTKVLHIITKLELGGAQRNTLYTVKNLDRSKFDVALTAGPGGILDGEAASTGALRFSPARHLARPVNPASDFLALIELVSIIRRERPDIVHTHSSKAGILGRFAAALCNALSISRCRPRVKIIHTFHGFGFTPAQSKIVHAVFLALEKLAAAVSDSLVFVSEANMREAVLRGIGVPGKYTLIRSGVDVEFFKNFRLTDEERAAARAEIGAAPADKIVSTIGPFKKQKNLGDFITAVSLLKEGGAKIRAVIAGDGEEHARLESLSRTLGVEKEIFFAGWLDTKEKIARLLKVTDVFLLTSLWEGLPRSLVEAAAAGVPICANAVDGVADIITDGETGLLAPPCDAIRAAANVEKIIGDENLARRLISSALARVDGSFDIKNMVPAQEKLYKALLGQM